MEEYERQRNEDGGGSTEGTRSNACVVVGSCLWSPGSPGGRHHQSLCDKFPAGRPLAR
jgi:hypothetical protein